MTDYIALGLKYGGFTSLDKVYLQNVLDRLPETEKLCFVTPPPSVINAYFSELYQKKSPSVATDYYFDLSKALHLLSDNPSFDEVKPFVRLNLLGKSYGFAYETSGKEIARVFCEKTEPASTKILFELARIFPQYKIYVEDNCIKMAKIDFTIDILENLTPSSSMLTRISRLKGDVIKLQSFNDDELAEWLPRYVDNGKIYYTFEQREFIVYVKNTTERK